MQIDYTYITEIRFKAEQNNYLYFHTQEQSLSIIKKRDDVISSSWSILYLVSLI